MIDSSAQRVLRDYHDQPQLAGQRLVLTLADLYGALEDVAGADTLLEGFVADANPRTNPRRWPMRAKTCQYRVAARPYDALGPIVGSS